MTHTATSGPHNLNVSASLETKEIFSGIAEQTDIPNVLTYNSTLRWLENKMFMIAGIPRLTRRGKLFGNVKPRKQPFGRVFKSIRVTIYLHKFKVYFIEFIENLFHLKND